MVRAVAGLGLNLFGENKVQEAKAKIPLCPGNLRWHMIGHLQTNKCGDAVRFFEMIQSVESVELAAEINKRAGQAAKTMPILLEVNIAGEASKFGYPPDRLLKELEQINALKRIEIQGLMTIAPWTTGPLFGSAPRCSVRVRSQKKQRRPRTRHEFSVHAPIALPGRTL